MHANAIANGVVVSFPSKMLTHRKIAPATIKPKLAMMKSLFSIFFISFSPISLSSIAHGQNIQGYLAFACLSSPVTLKQP